MFRLLALLLLMLTAAAAPALDAPIPPFRADFDLIRNGDRIGKAHIELVAGKDGWQFTTRSEGTEGLAGFAGVRIDENSTFRWHDDKPETMHYRYFQKAAWRKKHRQVDVDHAAKRVTAGDDDGAVALAYAPATVDRNLVLLALAADLKRNHDTLAYHVVDKRDVDTHRYKITGRQTVATARGRFECIVVERIRQKAGRTTTTWIAPALGYTPVRIVQREPDGETLEMLLR